MLFLKIVQNTTPALFILITDNTNSASNWWTNAPNLKVYVLTIIVTNKIEDTLRNSNMKFDVKEMLLRNVKVRTLKYVT